MTTSTVIDSPNAPKAIGPYEQARQCGDWVVCSGQIPLALDGSLVGTTPSEQTRQVIRNLQAVLAAAGYGLSDVVKTTVFLSKMDHYSEVNQVYAEYFGANPPARSAVEVSRLPKDVLVEIEAMAWKSSYPPVGPSISAKVESK